MDYWDDLFLILRVFIMHCEFFAYHLTYRYCRPVTRCRGGLRGSEELPVSTSFLVLTLI